MYILGINMSHNASACLLHEGEIIGCVSEERFNGIKNYFGYPKESIHYLLKEFNILPADIDYIVNAGTTSMHVWSNNTAKKSTVWKIIIKIINNIPSISILDLGLRQLYYVYVRLFTPRRIYESIINDLRVPRDKILLAPHHACHAYSAYYGFFNKDHSKTAVLTQDAFGDFLCATVSLPKNNHLRKFIGITAGNSIAALYTAVTAYLGMKMYEHEYKVMGLAPYATNQEIAKVYPIFDNLFKVDNLKIKSKLGTVSTYLYLNKILPGKRFDGIAGAIQKLTEIKICEWTKNILEETGSESLVLGGGLFMNVKLNKVLSELAEIRSVTVCPSAGDESNAIGACYFGYEFWCEKMYKPFNPRIIKNLYLGPKYDNNQIKRTLGKISKYKKKYRIKGIKDMEKVVARLLAKGDIVARFKGRMEFGARALGNRSILANPKDPKTIRIINEKIKNRDFWMPFSPSILKEREKDYLINPKSNKSPFMTFAFDTTYLAKKELLGALHPYDFTARAQILDYESNPSYYTLIREFEKITGIGGILNTSFNLHGKPIVCTPEDALYTFLNSGLKYLAIENYLIEKL